MLPSFVLHQISCLCRPLLTALNCKSQGLPSRWATAPDVDMKKRRHRCRISADEKNAATIAYIKISTRYQSVLPASISGSTTALVASDLRGFIVVSM